MRKCQNEDIFCSNNNIFTGVSEKNWKEIFNKISRLSGFLIVYFNAPFSRHAIVYQLKILPESLNLTVSFWQCF